jgi:formylglycine-generating enzyme required for sulfatase activity
VKKLLPVCILILLTGYCAVSQDSGKAGEAGTPDSLSADSVIAIEDTLVLPPDTMALVPGGEYYIGEKKGLIDQRPRHKVKVKSFYLDVHEVSNAQYQAFLEDAGHRKPLYWDDTTFNKSYLPVTGVSWEDAAAYCDWAGKRLPTEAEWEIAARGALEGEEYPWKGSAKKEHANYRFKETEPPQGMMPVGQYATNGYGLYDMAGNVWEWTADYYSASIYADTSTWSNPAGPPKGAAKVIRGGAWNYTEEFLGCGWRNKAAPDLRVNYIGFRCARDAE